MSGPIIWSWPNQQVVREDQSGPGVPDENPDYPLAEEAPNLNAMTKDELLDEAALRGVDADESMTKAEIREAIGE